jgi:DNA (cytosine-5)-methyltransferase 1
MDNQPGTIREMALFAGAGGGILGGHLLGWKTICAVEWEPYPACVLVARQNDKILPPFPIWDDVQTFDGRPWRGLVDVVSGGFPCQDISSAGGGAGIDGARSGMWREMARIVGEVRPRLVFVENSPMLVGRGAAVVISDLAKMGYDCQWCIVSASDCGAPHQRDRFWLVGYTNDYGQAAAEVSGGAAQRSNRSKTWQEQASELEGSSQQHEAMADTASQRLERQFRSKHQGARVRSTHGSEMADTTSIRQQEQRQRRHASDCEAHKGGKASHANDDGYWWAAEPNVGRVADGVAARVDRLKAIGNGQVPIVAATAFSILRGR